MAEKIHLKLLTVKKALTSKRRYKAFGKAHLCIITSKIICTLFHKETGFSWPRNSPAHPPAMWAGPWEGGCEKGAAHTRMCAESLCLGSRTAVTRVMPLISSVNSCLQNTDGGHGRAMPMPSNPPSSTCNPRRARHGGQNLDFIQQTLPDDSGSSLYLEFTFRSGSGTSSAAAAPSL